MSTVYDLQFNIAMYTKLFQFCNNDDNILKLSRYYASLIFYAPSRCQEKWMPQAGKGQQREKT